MLHTFDLPISWRELLARTARETMNDNVTGLAAQLAFYFFLALFPALLFLVALASFLPLDVVDQMVVSLRGFAPEEVVSLFETQLDKIADGQDGGLLTLGILVTLWSTSAAMVGIVDAMNGAYDIDEGRPWWKVRVTAIGLTIGIAVFVIAAFTIVILGPVVTEWMSSTLGFGTVFYTTWSLLQWPLAFVLVAIAVAIVNYFAPDADQDWEWVTPGAVLATLLWLVASLVFRFYVANFSNYAESYGTIGGIIVLMLWFYVSALALLVGAEMNAEIEHASPHGKDPGEKKAGEKKKLGARAARAYEQRIRAGGGQA